MNTKSKQQTKQFSLRNTLSAAVILVVIFISGCKPNDNEPPKGAYETGVFITNEGPFGSGTGTVSFYNRATGEVSNNIFEIVNNRPLGNVVQSMEVHNGKAYIVVNNAAKVEVVNAGDFVSAGVIDNVGVPRFFLGIDDNKGYVSDWNSGIKVINLSNNLVSATIATGGTGAEQMAKSGNEVFVANLGGFGLDSTVAVINSLNNTLVSTINVGHRPQSLVTDANGKLWVLCSGNQDWLNPANDTPGKLVRINTSTKAVELTLTFPSASDHPLSLTTNAAKNKLYYSLNGAVYETGISATSLPSVPVINRAFYNIGIDPETGYLFGTDALDFVQNGYVLRYNISTGSAVDSFQVGVIPGGFYFK